MNLQRKYYRQSIFVFGAVIPAILCAIVIIGASVYKNRIDDSYRQKVTQLKKFRADNAKAVKLQTEIGSQNDDLVRWEKILNKETAITVAAQLRRIEKKLPSKEFQKTSQNYPNSSAGLAKASAQKSSQIQLGFRGSYRSMQKALLELESSMPQIQLNNLSIEKGRQAGSLTFDFSYTAWEQ